MSGTLRPRTNSRTIGRISSRISSLEAFSRAVRLKRSIRWRCSSTLSVRNSSFCSTSAAGTLATPFSAVTTGIGCGAFCSFGPLMKRPNIRLTPCDLPWIETKR
ncbi:exported hypothetical protein [Mesorhizobium sp. ORS 3324]|nr:exported hypothetical protein [Mesorhizobium sp. ORS 3324]